MKRWEPNYYDFTHDYPFGKKPDRMLEAEDGDYYLVADVEATLKEIRSHVHRAAGRQIHPGDALLEISRVLDKFESSDVEAANAWRYDQPEKPGMYLASVKDKAGVEVIQAHFNGYQWSDWVVYAWMPLPEPAKEKP